MKKFMYDHPITSFLIVDVLVSGIVNIVKILKGPGNSASPSIIETTFADDNE